MNAENKAYVEKVNTELKRINDELVDFETLAKAKDEQVAIDIVNQLRSTHQKMEQQRQALAASADEKMKQEKDDIDKGIAKLKTGLAQLKTKLKSGPHTKAS
jgi:predicted  nucleic acid-binding Zn-ribbon protein